MLINHRFNHLYSFRAPIDFMTRRDINIGIAYNQLRNSPYFICLSKKAPETEKMMNRINKAIAEMRNDGAFEMIQSRYGRHPIN
jgi:polar amino acid transport system substrate-binding protein